MTLTVAEYRLRQVRLDAAAAKRAHERADEWDQNLYASMRKAHADGASLSEIAAIAGCSKEWARRCVKAAPGDRP